MRTRSFCSVLFLIVPAFIALGNQPATAGRDDGFRPPVSAPVTDPFRPPAGAYGAGNRGLDYATAPGTPVGAIGAGTVVFAGSIGHQLFVTVLHGNGLRSSYSFLATIDVTLGQVLTVGQRVGTAGDHLQLGVRRGDQYIDPAGLFGPQRRPHLVRPPR